MEIGYKKVNVNLLQFIVDTLFVCEAKFQNMMVIKSKLRCFDMASRLRVNFHKSKFETLGVDKNEFKKYSQALNCNIMEVPFKYLGETVGGNPTIDRKVLIICWKNMLNKICDHCHVSLLPLLLYSFTRCIQDYQESTKKFSMGLRT